MLRKLLDNLLQRPEGMTPSGCGRARLLMLPYLDGDLKPTDRSLFEAHITRCSACRAELAAFRSAESALGSAASAIPSPGDLRPEFYARLEQSRRTAPPIGWKLAVPALAAVAVLGFLLYPKHGVMAPDQQIHDVIAPSATNSHEALLTKPMRSGIGTKATEMASNLSTTPKRSSALRKVRPLRAFVHRQEVAKVELERLHSPVRRKLIEPVRKSPSLVASLSASDRPEAQYGFYKVAGLNRAASPSTFGLSPSAASAPEAEVASKPHDREESRTILASLVTEVHVSDEARDFMSSTHVDSKSSRPNTSATLRVDDENENTEIPVELPPLP